MSKFLDSTGLSRLVENIKNKFQPKPFLLELSVSYDKQTNEGTVSIRKDDIARAFDHLYKYKDSSDYNISFKVYHSNYECTYICKANSITFDDDAIFTINIDYNLYLADDNDQDVGYIRLDLDRERVEGYYNEQNIVYDNSVLLTGTGVAIKPERYFINFEDRAFYLINDNGIGFAKSFSFDKKEDMQVLFNKFLKYEKGNLFTSMSFNIFDSNLRNNVAANFIVTDISTINTGDTIEVSFFINDFNTGGYDTDTMDIRKYSLVILKDGTLDDFISHSISIDLNSLKKAEDAARTIYTKGSGTKFLADDGSYMNTSKLITFEAENGSLNAEQTDAIEEGYLRNLPIYVLYSGIKMLVNGIQKLGDIYSLSCRHDNSTYSITMNLDDNSYEISSIRE